MDQLTAAALLNYLLDHLQVCDTTFTQVRAYFEHNEAAAPALASSAIAWLESRDTLCDCEALLFLLNYVEIAY